MDCSITDLKKRPNPLMKIQLVSGDKKKTHWLKKKIALPNKRYKQIRELAAKLKIATVCGEALCPNINECWGAGTATFMLMGDTCTRACRFCNVNHGKPQPLNAQEPENLAEAIKKLKLDYVVLTCVDRDDLDDAGTSHLAHCIEEVKKVCPKILVEILGPDFSGDTNCVETLLNSEPNVFAHNIETVERLQPVARDRRANYKQSLAVLDFAKKYSPKIYTKSSIMVGLGEKSEEVIQTMRNLQTARVDFLTIGQYLRPSAWNLKVVEYVSPQQFERYKEEGLKLGFKYVLAGPFVRSSYMAGELFLKNILNGSDRKF